MASYGRGVEASEAGLQKQAKEAFEEALRQDPDFAKASLALRDLSTMAEVASKKEKSRYDAKVQASLDKALKALPSELGRKASFKDTRASLLDFTLRQHLLKINGNHCARYAELKHFFLRKKGEFEGWFIGLRPVYQDSWAAGRDRMEERAKELGLVGRETLFGSDARGLMFEASTDTHLWQAALAIHLPLTRELQQHHRCDGAVLPAESSDSGVQCPTKEDRQVEVTGQASL